MEVEVTEIYGWDRALDSARRTIGEKPLHKEPSKSWKAKMLLSEHSPIRRVEYTLLIKNVRQWVTVHLVRHHEGCEKFVHTQRQDKNPIVKDRDSLPQGALNDMEMVCNAQSLINISKVRLCTRASKETREVWEGVKKKIGEKDPIMASKMVRSCVYRGFCPEIKCCGYCFTDSFKREREEYMKTDY